jgi:hypothetical protein
MLNAESLTILGPVPASQATEAIRSPLVKNHHPQLSLLLRMIHVIPTHVVTMPCLLGKLVTAANALAYLR